MSQRTPPKAPTPISQRRDQPVGLKTPTRSIVREEDASIDLVASSSTSSGNIYVTKRQNGSVASSGDAMPTEEIARKLEMELTEVH